MIAEVNLYVQFNITNNHCLTSIDLEYWKMPSRRFYVAKKDEYEDMLTQCHVCTPKTFESMQCIMLKETVSLYKRGVLLFFLI